MRGVPFGGRDSGGRNPLKELYSGPLKDLYGGGNQSSCSACGGTPDGLGSCGGSSYSPLPCPEGGSAGGYISYSGNVTSAPTCLQIAT